MCTGISYKSLEGHQYLGRTQEYSLEYDYILAQFPREYDADIAITPWQTKYSVLGVAIRLDGQVAPAVVDGINEHGLTLTTQFFAKCNVYSSIEDIQKNNKFPLLAEQFIFWLLANCRNIEEVLDVLNQVAIADVPFTRGEHGLPLHFLCKEPSGRTIVIEPSKKLGFEVFENEVGVMTNSPAFDWHLTNLENYVGLADSKANNININDCFPLEAGKNSGLRGLPGDFSAASRFIRTTYLLYFSDEVDTIHSINRGFHILNTTDITKGTIKLDEEDAPRQYTQYTSIYDITNKQMYIKLYDNCTIQSVAFNEMYCTGNEAKVYELVKTPHYLHLD